MSFDQTLALVIETRLLSVSFATLSFEVAEESSCWTGAWTEAGAECGGLGFVAPDFLDDLALAPCFPLAPFFGTAGVAFFDLKRSVLSSLLELLPSEVSESDEPDAESSELAFDSRSSC